MPPKHKPFLFFEALGVVGTIVVLFLGGLLWDRCNPFRPGQGTIRTLPLDSILQTSAPPWAWRGTTDTASLHKSVNHLTPFPFDPNTADSATLSHLGLSPRVVRNLLKYRQAGGRLRQPDDMARIYGLSEADFLCLRPYIRLAVQPDAKFNNHHQRPKYDTHPLDTATINRYRRYAMEKFETLTLVDINAADTTLLMRIPGIGHYRATQVVRYRERLGGYVRVEQVNEIEGFPTELLEWFSVTPHVSRRIAVNRLTFSQLLAHPYLNYEQVKVIMTLIRQSGSIRSIEDLAMLDAFTPADLARLEPYLSFEWGPPGDRVK